MKYSLSMESFHSMISLAFNFMTHKELVIVPREFYLNETHFFSFFLNTLSYYQKYRDNLFNTNKTPVKLLLRLA
jgi:hypothetical protein